jgi:protein-S-isoprenylcysteine O-methyltransferase Ste14
MRTNMTDASRPAKNTLRAPVPPPVLFFVLLLLGVAVDHFRPLTFLPEGLTVQLLSALSFFALAVAIGVWAFSTFRRCRTSAEFGEPVSTLVQQGPYRFSRNPLYVALILVLAGFACALNNAWLAIVVPALSVALDRLVVAREERFLSDLLGPDYLSYRARGRRWC